MYKPGGFLQGFLVFRDIRSAYQIRPVVHLIPPDAQMPWKAPLQGHRSRWVAVLACRKARLESSCTSKSWSAAPRQVLGWEASKGYQGTGAG